MTQLDALLEKKRITKVLHKKQVRAARAAFTAATTRKSNSTALSLVCDTTDVAEYEPDAIVKVPWPCSDLAQCIQVETYSTFWQGIASVRKAFVEKTLFSDGFMDPDERTRGQPGGAGQSTRGYVDWAFTDMRGLRCVTFAFA